MSTVVQQLTWEVKKADLEALLKNAGQNYAALQFKLCIDDAGTTKFLVSIVGTSKSTMQNLLSTADATTGPQLEISACPVPPGCS